jgi:uncharacterized membrane protein
MTGPPESAETKSADESEQRRVALREEDERRWRKVFRILYSLVAATAVVGVWTYVLSTSDAKQNKIDKARTVELQQITRGLRQSVRDIQQSRIDITRDACEDQNRRHDRTIRRLNSLVRKAAAEAADPARRAQLRASAGGSIFLIDALAPKVDCDALVAERFGEVPLLGARGYEKRVG